MKVFENIEIESKTNIIDMSFDWMGKRLALVDTDKCIYIYNLVHENKWEKSTKIYGHNSIIWKIKWGHPDFGGILATYSLDKNIIIWEEKFDNNIKEFREKVKIYKPNNLIEDIKFAPKNNGLVLAAAFNDGFIKLFDIESNNPSEEILKIECFNSRIGSFSWNKNILDNESFIVGSKEKGFGIKIFIKNNSYKSIINFAQEEHKNGVNDISWGQLNGRSHHCIFTCGNDSSYIWLINISKEDEIYKVNIINKINLSNKNSIPLKMCCNFLSTVVCISYDTKEIKFWKKDNLHNWKLINKLSSNENNLPN